MYVSVKTPCKKWPLCKKSGPYDCQYIVVNVNGSSAQKLRQKPDKFLRCVYMYQTSTTVQCSIYWGCWCIYILTAERSSCILKFSLHLGTLIKYGGRQGIIYIAWTWHTLAVHPTIAKSAFSSSKTQNGSGRIAITEIDIKISTLKDAEGKKVSDPSLFLAYVSTAHAYWADKVYSQLRYCSTLIQMLFPISISICF